MKFQNSNLSDVQSEYMKRLLFLPLLSIILQIKHPQIELNKYANSDNLTFHLLKTLCMILVNISC